MSDKILDFSLRPNKSVERKLIFEALASLHGLIRWAEYQYIGMGSLWFKDFVLAHRLLRIATMHSIERSSSIASRAEASRPLKCIKMHVGTVSEKLLSPELHTVDRKSVVWLDYFDTATEETLGDLLRLCRDLPVGSVLLVTLNADTQNLGNSAAERTRYLQSLFGAWVPDPPDTRYFSSALHGFPKNLGELVWARAVGTTRAAGKDMTTLFNFAYKDGAPMITVGGLVVNDKLKSEIRNSGIRKQPGVLRTGRLDIKDGWPRMVEQHRIEVPVLTRLERMRLNRELPGKLGSRKVRKLCGHELSKVERDTYALYFAQYPTFAEIDL